MIEIIAECGINHKGDMFLAKRMIYSAKQNGANVAKFQIYDVDTLFPDRKIIAQDRNWYEEVKKTQLTKEQVFELDNYCKEVQIEFMASAFDLERLGWLEEVGVKRHKIAYRMNRDKKYLRDVLKTKKTILMSCDFRTLLPFRRNIRRLYCVPKYPTEFSKLKLERVNFPLGFKGFSDHTVGIEASMIAMVRGAEIIEKHFCLERDNSNPDMVCSIEPQELKQLVEFARKVEEVL